jgi:hypothetical protein
MSPKTAFVAALALVLAGCIATPSPDGVGPADIMTRLDLTKEQETLVWPVIVERLNSQSVLLRQARAGTDIGPALERERYDADSALDDVLNDSQWAEWTTAMNELDAQALAAR